MNIKKNIMILCLPALAIVAIVLGGWQSTPPLNQVFQPITIVRSGTPTANSVPCSPQNNAFGNYRDTSTTYLYTCDNSTGVFAWSTIPTNSVAPQTGILNAGGQGINISSTNTTRVIDWVSPASGSFSKMTYRVSAADASGTNLYDMGIYSNSGTLLCHTGPTIGTTAWTSVNAVVTLNFITPCVLVANTRYLWGGTGNAIVGGIQGNFAMSAQANVSPTSGSTTSGGTLNASITPATDTWALGVQPMFVLHN
jgi:hypothetical protein